MKKMMRSISVCGVQAVMALLLAGTAIGQKTDNVDNQYINEGSTKTLFTKSKPNSLYEQAPKTELFVGLSTIFEKSNSGYAMVGVNGAFTRYIDANFGATIEAGYYAGKSGKNKYNRALMMVGGSYYVDINQVEGLTLSPYALIGLARVTADIPESNVIAKNGAFTAAIGTAVNYEVNSFITAGLRADINPIIYNGFVSTNPRIGLGLVFRAN